MRVLVTGHKGYIGTVLVPMLIMRGFETIGLDSDLFSACTFGDTMPDSRSAMWTSACFLATGVKKQGRFISMRVPSLRRMSTHAIWSLSRMKRVNF